MEYSKIISLMRENLQPKGSAPIVLLRPMHSVGIEMNADFVAKCIDELERIPARIACGDAPSNLEKLAYQLLLDSAYIDLNYEKEREELMSKLRG